ncbi:MAG TPA: hypothetical protein VFC54_05060 [Pseudolabrys sp.]|nr:hypothetical protein [Pseudolabrys sp.]
MDTLHTVLRSIRRETKSRRDHIDIFREFLDHLDRAAKRKGTGTDKSGKAPKVRAKRGKR